MLNTVIATERTEQIEKVFTVVGVEKEPAKELSAPIIKISARIEAKLFNTVSRPEKRYVRAKERKEASSISPLASAEKSPLSASSGKKSFTLSGNEFLNSLNSLLIDEEISSFILVAYALVASNRIKKIGKNIFIIFIYFKRPSLSSNKLFNKGREITRISVLPKKIILSAKVFS